MTLTVENGTGVSNANSYVSPSDHVAYAALYGVTVTSGQAEINLRKAMDDIESRRYKGTKKYATSVNTLKFPRDNVCIEGEIISYTESLTRIVKVQNEMALGIYNGADPLAMKGGKVVSEEKFGDMEISYATSKEVPLTNPRVDLFINPLLLEKVAPLHFKVVSDKESAYCCNHSGCPNTGCLYLDGYSYYE